MQPCSYKGTHNPLKIHPPSRYTRSYRSRLVTCQVQIQRTRLRPCLNVRKQHLQTAFGLLNQKHVETIRAVSRVGSNFAHLGGSGRVGSGRVGSGGFQTLTGRVESPLPDPTRSDPRGLTRPVTTVAVTVLHTWYKIKSKGLLEAGL